MASFQVLLFDSYFEIMLIFSSVDIESSSISFVSNTISNSTSENQTAALHVIVHHIFQNWLKTVMLLHKIEEDLFIGSYIDSNVTFDEVK